MATISKGVVERLKKQFLHQYCVFYLKDMNILMPTQDGEGISTTAAMEGFVVDIDEHGYYLGREEDGTITKIIGHDVAQVVELMTETVSNFEHLFDVVDEGDVH